MCKYINGDDMIFGCDSLFFGILTVERVRHKDGKFSVKERPYAALSIRISGISTFTINGIRFCAEKGDVVFIPENQTYEVEYFDSEFIVAHLPNCNYNQAERITPHNKEAVYSVFLRMLEHWKQNRSSNKVKAYIYEIFNKLEEDQNDFFESCPEEFQKCLNYLNENFCDSSLKIESICDLYYISRSSLQRYFLRYLNLSPKQYLLQLRLNKAMDLLASENKTVAKISESCGFSDEKYFSRIFKQQYGISPREARHRTHI